MRLWWVVLFAACGSSSHAPDAGRGSDAGADASPHAAVRIIAINDFHGGIDSEPGIPGAAALAAAIDSERTPNTVIVSAGDLIGGSPLTSGLYHDEPTIDVMNAIGLQYNAVGNHEFDEGATELLRMQNGGCHPTDGCGNGSSFGGAQFQFLAANVTYTATGERIFPAYAIHQIAGVKIAFVGVTTVNTRSQTLASAVTDLSFADEVTTVNALVPELKAAGAQAIVVLLHEGGTTNMTDGNSCDGLAGRIIDVTNGFDPAVTWVASAHSHVIYNCMLGGHLLTSAGFHGRAITVADLDFDLGAGTLAGITAVNMPVSAMSGRDATVGGIVAEWDQRAEPTADRVVGTITADIGGLGVESQIGDLVTDAMLAGTSPQTTQAALMNPGGLRSVLGYAKIAPETVDGQVRYAETFAVQPFSNHVLAVTVTGADLVAALDTWACNPPPLQVAGLTYTIHPGQPPGSCVTLADVQVGGAPVVAANTYRVAVNSIVAQPASTPSMANATNVVDVGVDLDLLNAYLGAHSPVAPETPSRITQQ
ncbi:MAG TPA: bifunctional metallophosphatase/5'-nucleotidase [Kofleriaceae bacterium]|nr:bifunctional metallophosphatase/5'-nucleotidase [Kofleriaceae bacterium]